MPKVFGYAFDNTLIPTNPNYGLKQFKEPERIPTALTAAQSGQIMNVLHPPTRRASWISCTIPACGPANYTRRASSYCSAKPAPSRIMM